MIKKDQFKKILKEKGFKLTTQRDRVLSVLQDNASQHMTVEEIYNKVKEQCPDIGLATVYRTIQLLHDLKMIEKLNLNDGCIRYEMGKFDEAHHHHHHLICENCGRVYEVEDDLLESIEEIVSQKYNFKINNHVVKFYGICGECN